MDIFNIFKKKSLDRYSLFNGIEPYENKHKSQYDFLKLNELSFYLNKSIEKRADKVGEVDFIITQNDEVVEHPLLSVLNKPNNFHTGFQFWGLVQKYLDLTGEAFIFVERERELFESSKIKALHLLRPDLVDIEYNQDGSVKGYTYKRQDKVTIKYEPIQILHIFNPDPMNPLRGMSLIKSGIRAIDTEVQLSEYHARVIANGGKVEGVFKINDPTMTKEKLLQIKESYKEQYSGSKKSGLPLFLGGDIEYQNIGLNPSELSYLETKKVSLNDICILTGVPKEILASVGETTYANADAAYGIFLRETIKPIMRRLVTILDWKLLDEKYDLDFIDPTPENIDKKLEAIKMAYEINAISLNEKRNLISQTVDGFDLEPRSEQEADQIYQPLNLSPISSNEEKPKKPEDKTEKKMVKKKLHTH